MMRLAMAIQPLYPQLNLDLLIAGVLFHDSGKLWENHLPETGFTMGYDERGELMGHISIGLELVNSIWRKLQTDENVRAWSSCTPSSEDVRRNGTVAVAASFVGRFCETPWRLTQTPYKSLRFASAKYSSSISKPIKFFTPQRCAATAEFPIPRNGSSIVSTRSMPCSLMHHSASCTGNVAGCGRSFARR